MHQFGITKKCLDTVDARYKHEETDIDRKYHTRHGLHFNKLGKLLFSNKITQMIYLILGDKQKQSTVMSEKYGNQGDESEVDGRNSNQVNKDFKNNEDIIK